MPVENRRRFRRLLYILVPVLLMLATGCDDKDDRDNLNGAVLTKEPAAAQDCGEGPHPAKQPNGLPDVTMHWLAGTHSLGESATLYLCQEQPTAGTVKLVPSPGVRVSPTSLNFNATDEAILKFVVTVDSNAKSGADITLVADLTSAGFLGALDGPTIHIADDRWSFDLPGRGGHERTHPDNTSRNVILLGVLGCIVGAVCFVAGVTRNSGKGVVAAVVVFLLGVALVLVGFGTRPPPAPLCEREPQARGCGF